MSKTTAEKRMSVEEQIRQLENQRKELLQKERDEERKARNHRLCKRGGLVEKLLPDLIVLTDEQFQIFLNKTLLTEHTRRVICDLTAGKAEFCTLAPGASNNPHRSSTGKPQTAETERAGG
jgi:hypothetical protein